MKNLLFTPILKTKARSELYALTELKELLLKRKNIIPYLECIKPIDNPIVNKYLSLLQNKNTFIEINNEDMKNYLLGKIAFTDNFIPVLRINDLTSKEEVDEFIKFRKKLNKKYGIKIDDADDRYIDLFVADQDAYLFIELGGTRIESSDFLSDLSAQQYICSVIIHSNERDHYLRGEDFNDLRFNDENNFNFSIITSIKDGKFTFNGFGSRCSAKNEQTEQAKIARPVHGYFLIYNYESNNFYSIKSDNKDYISKIYNEVKNKIIVNKSYVDPFFRYTPVSKDFLSKKLAETKTQSTKFIAVSIIHYIEEIANNLI